MFKLISLLIIILTISDQIWAQCGVHFKEQSRQVLSNAIGNGYFEDFDNDGKDDLLGYSWTSYVNGGASSFEFHYYKRLGAESFDTTAKTTAITNVNHNLPFVVGDINGDGYKDIVVKILTGPQTIRTYLNDGTGNFIPAANDYVSNENVYAASDLNGDGKADLIISNLNVNLGYRLTQPDNSFGGFVAISNIGYMQSVRNLNGLFGSTLITPNPLLVEDLNGDGSKDIAYIEGVNFNYVFKVLTNNGNLTFTPTASFNFPGAVNSLKAYDLNNDGKKDFISDVSGNGYVTIAVNNGNNTITNSTIQLPDYFINSYSQHYKTKKFSVSDLDSDGDLDVIYPALTAYRILRNQGNATFTTELINSYTGADHTVNLDNDGKTDTVFLNYSMINGSYRLSDGNNWYYYYLHNAVSFRKNVCSPVGQTKVVDFDGDGYVDRALWNPQTGMWRYYPSKLFTSQNFQLGQMGDVPLPNDYDGDGITDFAVYRKSNGTWSIVGSSGQNISGFQFGISTDKPVPADYDGDGKADIAVYRPSNGTWHFWYSGSSQYRAVQFGLAEDKVVPSDYDGDGKADIAVWRPSTQVWYILKSSDGSFSAIQYGLGTDIPVPGDYDGDGKANITLYRNGVWYVLKSDFSTTGMYFGIANDVPFYSDTLQGPLLGVYRSSNLSAYTSADPRYSAFAQATGNSASEIFVSSILPPQ